MGREHDPLPDGRTGIDILVQQGRIAALGDHLFHGQPAPAGSEDIDSKAIKAAEG